MASKVGVIIVSAGRGKRLAKGDKAIFKLDNQPLFCKAVNTFSAIKEITEIVLVLRKTNFALARKCIKGKNIKIIEGGLKRSDSVFKGLLALGQDVEYVLIHDGARPFVAKKTVLNMLVELKKHSAVICGLRCPDTLKLVKKGVVKKTLDREDVYLIQTPQGFKKEIIISAYKKFNKRKLTDDSQMLEIIGKKVKVIPGDSLNFKITYPRDLKLAKIICDELNLRSRI